MSESGNQLQKLPQNLPMDADQALFTNRVRGMAVVLHRNERPLNGLAGLLDWRFHGAISEFLRTGAISGEFGQCAYIPITRHGNTYHLIFIGAGDCAVPGKRSQLPEECLEILRQNITGLKLEKVVAVSRSDLGGMTDEALLKKLKGLPLWIAQ